MSWMGSQAQPQPVPPQVVPPPVVPPPVVQAQVVQAQPVPPQSDGAGSTREGVPSPDAVLEEWERAVSEAMQTVRHALDLAHDRIRALSEENRTLQALSQENRTLRARLDRVAAALHEPVDGQGSQG